MPVTASELGLPLQLPREVWRTLLSRRWVDGVVWPIWNTSGFLDTSWPVTPLGCVDVSFRLRGHVCVNTIVLVQTCILRCIHVVLL